MRHTSLGRTGLAVSRLCLGTMTFGVQNTPEQSFAIMDTAVEAGITFFDTADVYPAAGGLDTAGDTERIIGDWMHQRGNRYDIVLATKCVGRMGTHRFQMGASRKHIFDAVDASLRRLRTDWIDLYQLHGFDPRTPQDESMAALDDLVRLGKVRYIGCSNHAAWQLARANGIAAADSRTRFDCVQPRYSLLFRHYERELFPLCGVDGIGVIPYNPIAGGLLSGKHSRDAGPTAGTRFAVGNAAARYQERYWNDAAFDTVEALRPIAAELGVSLVTLANAWVLAQPVVTAPIVGATRPEQLADAVAAVDVTLDADTLTRLDELTAQYIDVPFDMNTSLVRSGASSPP